MPRRAGRLRFNSPAPATVVGQSASATALQRQFVEMVNAVSPAVVQILTSQGLGSGIVLDDRGHIVTNAHVAANQTRVTVTLPAGGRYPATLVGTDPGHDLAVIHITGATPVPS